jgi:uncharacterized protein
MLKYKNLILNKNETMRKLEGKVIIIIGASGGIGNVLARYFSAEGAIVILVARTKENLEKVAATLSGHYLIFDIDATNEHSIEIIFNETQKKFGKVDAVVISAGTWKQLGLDLEMSESVELMDNDYKGIYKPTYVAGLFASKFFTAQGYGLIVNISSHAAIRPELDDNFSYGPMKSAAHHFIISLHRAFKRKRINVRATDLMPAIVNTPDAAKFLDTEEKRKKAVQPEKIPEWIIENFDNPDIPEDHLFDSELVV